MSYFTRRKQAYLPMTLIDPAASEISPKTSGNAAEPYVSFQEREKFVWMTPRSRINAFLAADGEEPVASNGVGFGSH